MAFVLRGSRLYAFYAPIKSTLNANRGKHGDVTKREAMEDNPFLISDDVNAEAPAGGEQPGYEALQADGGDFASMPEGDELGDGGAPEGLIPLCVRHAQGPKIDTALFGYDIALLEQRPWARPDANTSDYFNYGFNEHSWRAYCAMQLRGSNAVAAQAEEMLSRLRQDVEGAAAASGGARSGFGGLDSRREPRTTGYGQFYKTKLCRAFMEGRCAKSDCNFAHGEAELRPLHLGAPAHGAGPSSSMTGPPPPLGAGPFIQGFGGPMPPQLGQLQRGFDMQPMVGGGHPFGAGPLAHGGDPFAQQPPFAGAGGFRPFPGH